MNYTNDLNLLKKTAEETGWTIDVDEPAALITLSWENDRGLNREFEVAYDDNPADAVLDALENEQSYVQSPDFVMDYSSNDERPLEDGEIYEFQNDLAESEQNLSDSLEDVFYEIEPVLPSLDDRISAAQARQDSIKDAAEKERQEER